MSWTKQLIANVEAVDLGKPCTEIKLQDDRDTIIGELDAFCQRFHRHMRACYDEAYEVYQSIDDRITVHNEECHGEDGQHDPQLCRSHIEKVRELSAKLKPMLLEYANVRHLFWLEVNRLFPGCESEHHVLGIRDGKTLIGRSDNSRGDVGELDKIIDSPQTSIEVNLVHITTKDEKEESPMTAASAN